MATHRLAVRPVRFAALAADAPASAAHRTAEAWPSRCKKSDSSVKAMAHGVSIFALGTRCLRNIERRGNRINDSKAPPPRGNGGFRFRRAGLSRSEGAHPLASPRGIFFRLS